MVGRDQVVNYDEASKSATSLQVELYGADNDKMLNYHAKLKTIPNSPSNIELKPACDNIHTTQSPWTTSPFLTGYEPKH